MSTVNNTRHCLTCGRTEVAFEVHHIASRENHATLVVDLCVSCHRLITRWQGEAGIYLGIGPRHPVERLRAITVGSLLLVRLFAYRHPELAPLPADWVRIAARGVSGVLDLGVDPNRADRRGPNPGKIKRGRITAASKAYDAPVEEWLRLTIELDQALGDLTLVAEAVAYEHVNRAHSFELTQALRELTGMVDSITERLTASDPAGVTGAARGLMLLSLFLAGRFGSVR